jgi:hypothetical protein
VGFVGGLLDSLTRRVRGDDLDGEFLEEGAPEGVDAGTRAYWEAAAGPDAATPRRRLGTLVAEHDRPASAAAGRPRGNPAFSEALFVELMRARQFGRAFRLLAPDCQRRWGNAERFIRAQTDDATLAMLQGVQVVAVRDADGWTDPDAGGAQDHVAELDVEYAFGTGDRAATVRRTVHLVGVDGKWRSLYYPAGTGMDSSHPR